MKATRRTPVERRGRYHHGDLAAALRAVAIDLIAARGADGFSLREAAAAVRVSPSAAYRHYASKTELLTAVAEDSFAELNESMKGAMQGVALRADAADWAVARVQAMGRAYVRFALEHAARFQAMYGLTELCTHRRSAQASGPRPDDDANTASPSYQTLRSALDDLRRVGLLAGCAPDEAEMAIWSAIHGCASLLIAGMSPIPPATELDERVDRLVQCTLVGLSSPSGPSQSSERAARPAQADSSASTGRWSRLIVHAGERRVIVRTRDVDYIESRAGHARVHVGGSIHEMPESLSELEARLDPRHFLRVGAKVIVNLDRISEVGPVAGKRPVIVLATGARIPTTRGMADLERALNFC